MSLPNFDPSKSRRAQIRPFLILIIAACASGASSGAGPAPERVDPPKILTAGTFPQLRIPANSSARTPLSVVMEVMVDSTGHPDMTTFKVSGFGASENEDTLTHWMEQVIFQPAHRGNQPVPALFHSRVQGGPGIR
jgi:hypothetical protein